MLFLSLVQFTREKEKEKNSPSETTTLIGSTVKGKQLNVYWHISVTHFKNELFDKL